LNSSFPDTVVHFILQVEQWLTYWLIFGAFVVLETFEEY
jgi:hypothetical protein